MNRKDQEIVAFYRLVLRTAAKHHLTVDFHGAYAPSGEERTWPNLLTREGILGLEYSKWSDRATPRHNVTIPFTRMLVGPMDYTPGAFRNVTVEAFAPRNDAPVAMGTRGHHLAMYVVYDSPLQMLSDTPAAYRGEPGADFLKVVPASWDETRVLDGRIGEYVVIAPPPTPEQAPGPPGRNGALVEACREGRASAFEELYRDHGGRMKSVARNLLGNASDAEDAVQEAFLKLYRGLAGFKGDSALSSWLYRILVNTCYDIGRRRQRRGGRRSPPPTAAPPPWASPPPRG